MNFNLQSGYYWFGTKCQQKYVHFGILEVNGAEEASQPLGQWYFKFNYTEVENEGLPKTIDMRLALLDTSCRLGLKPVIFTDQFKQALQHEKNICLVADTSALHHGYLEQAIRLRQDKATHITIPDQVYMEIQLQREYNKKSKDQDCLKLRRLSKLQFASARSIRRLQEKRIVYYIRPPEAMVRYFGAELSEHNDGSEKGSNYQRDRLILEALRHQRQTLPNIPIWLVTGDANFAIQVELEGFNAGFTRQPKLPDQQFLITSPYIEPRSLTPSHLTIEEFLEECLWEWGIITLQLEGQAIRHSWDLSNEKACQDAQLDMQKIEKYVVYRKETCERLSTLKKSSPVFSLETSIKPVPKRAPSPSNLLEGLKSAVTKINREHLASQTFSYLQALQWIEKINDQVVISSRGQTIIETWSHLDPTDVRAWYDWIQEARKDIKRLDKQNLLQGTLTICQPETDESLVRKLGLSLRDMRSQSILAHAFGLVVRLQGKTWKVEDKPPQESAQLILVATSLLKVDQISRAVRVDKVFTHLLTKTPLSVPTFRIGLYELFERNQIRLGGTIPDSGENPVKVKVLVPQQNEQEIDLGAGDFLIPNESSQVIIL